MNSAKKSIITLSIALIMVISVPTLGSLLHAQTFTSSNAQSKGSVKGIVQDSGSNTAFISRIATSGAPSGAFYNSVNGCVYLITSAPSIQAISSSTNTIIGTINLAAASQPAGLLLDSNNQKIYITNHMSNDVSVIDTAGTTCTSTSFGTLESATISLGRSTGAGGLVYDSAHHNIYVENDGTSTVSVIDDTTDALSTTVTSNTIGITTMTAGWSHPIWYYPAGYVLVSPIDAFSRSGQVVAAISTTSQAVTYLIAGQDPFYAVFDPSNNNMYYDNSNANSPTRVAVITPTLGVSSITITASFSNPGVMAYDAANGCVYDANTGGALDIINTSTLADSHISLSDGVGFMAYDPTDQNMYIGTKSINTPHVMVLPPQDSTGPCTTTASNTIDIGSNGSAICNFVPSTANGQEWMYAVNCPVFNTSTAENFVAVLSNMDFTLTTSDPITVTLSNLGCGLVHVKFTSIPNWSGTVQFSTAPNPNSAGPVWAGVYYQGYIYTTSTTLAISGSATLPLAIWASNGTTGTYTVSVTASDGSANRGPPQTMLITVIIPTGHTNSCSSQYVT